MVTAYNRSVPEAVILPHAGDDGAGHVAKADKPNMHILLPRLSVSCDDIFIAGQCLDAKRSPGVQLLG